MQLQISPIEWQISPIRPSLAMLGFERWQSANKGLSQGSVIDHLGSINGVDASRMEVVFN